MRIPVQAGEMDRSRTLPLVRLPDRWADIPAVITSHVVKGMHLERDGRGR